MKKWFIVSLLFNIIIALSVGYAIIKIGSPRYLFYLIKYRGQGITSLKKHRTSHLAQLQIPENSIVMLGNSITASCEWSELLGNKQIVNRGVIGDGTDDILERLTDVTRAKPRQIFLLIGVNDLLFHPPQYIIENYKKIVDRIRTETPETELFLESVLPIHNDLRRNGMRNEDIETINKGIKEITIDNKLTYIDLYSKFKDTEGGLKIHFSLDGIHLNGDGYQLFREIIMPFLENIHKS